MDDNVAYGKLTKRIVFVDSDHRHAQLLIGLKNDNLSQSDFFRSLITGYIENDERIRSYIEDISKTSQKRKSRSRNLRQRGRQQAADLGLTSEDVHDIFDIIAEEHPDL